MILKSKISALRRDLDQAMSYEEWRQIASELDALEGLDLWKLSNDSPHYNHEMLRDRLVLMRACLRNNDMRNLVRSLREGLNHDLGNMGHPLLYCAARVGTKRLIEDYIEQVCLALDHVCDHDIEFLPYDKKVGFFKDTAQSFGQPALMLSGGATLGLFHVGVCKALQEQGLLPKVISGSSAGAIVAAMIGSRTVEELEALYEGDGLYMTPWRYNPILKGLAGEGFADQEQLEKFLRTNIGEYSFEEAYARTGRHINITVSPIGKNHKSRLMNELTSPYLLVWSAVLASCAVPVLFPPVTLMTKTDEGDIVPYMPMKRWVDGSVKSDLPKNRLMHLYDVNYFIAAQVNPHIVPFLQDDQQRFGKKLSSWPNRFVRAEAQLLGTGVLDFLRHQVTSPLVEDVLDQGYSLLNQRYYGDVTIAPKKYSLQHYRHVLQNPTQRTWNWFRLQGERATWPKIAMIRTHARIAQTLTNCIERLETNRSRRTSDRSLMRIAQSGATTTPV